MAKINSDDVSVLENRICFVAGSAQICLGVDEARALAAGLVRRADELADRQMAERLAASEGKGWTPPETAGELAARLEREREAALHHRALVARTLMALSAIAGCFDDALAKSDL